MIKIHTNPNNRYGATLKIDEKLLNVARERALANGHTVKFVVEKILRKDLLPSPKDGRNTASKNARQKGGSRPRP